jgi:hypothetical protein
MEMLNRTVQMLITAVLLAVSAPLYAAPYKATVPATKVEAADLTFMREEEKLARDTYLTLYDKWGLAIFSSIASSEQSHMDALLKLLNKYKLPDPVGTNLIGQFTNPGLQDLYFLLTSMGSKTSLDALKVGSTIEEKDMKDINDAIQRADKPDIIATYESLLCGSRNHLRSFEQNIKKLTGAYYYANYLDPAEVDEIINSPMETCGR